MELYEHGPCVLPKDCRGLFNLTSEFAKKVYNKGATALGDFYDKTATAIGKLWNSAFD